MKIGVHLYAQLRDAAGVGHLDVDLADQSTVAELLGKVYEMKPALRSHDKTILIGAGVEFVDRNYKLQPGDEISIMPPVQGG
jgi:molybdopterin converting factor small subunit